MPLLTYHTAGESHGPAQALALWLLHGTWRSALLAVIVTLAAPSAALATLFPEGNSTWVEPASQSPTQLVEFSSAVTEILDAPQVSDACAIRSFEEVDLWALFVFVWPEIVVVVAGSLFGILLLRSIRRGRGAGVEQCRACGYLAVGHPYGATCPECGVKLAGSNRIIRSPRLTRTVVLAPLMLMTLGGYVLGRNFMPRTGSVSLWTSMWCELPPVWITGKPRTFLLQFARRRAEFVRVDTRAGVIAQQFPLDWIYLTDGWCEPFLINGHLAWSRCDSRTVRARHVDDWSVVFEVELPLGRETKGGFEFPISSIAVSADNRTLYFLRSHRDVCSLDIASGHWQSVAQLDAPCEGSVVRLRDGDRELVIRHWKRDECRTVVLNLGSRQLTPIALAECAPTTAGNFGWKREDEGVRVWDLRSVTELGVVPFPLAPILDPANPAMWTWPDPVGDLLVDPYAGYQRLAGGPRPTIQSVPNPPTDGVTIDDEGRFAFHRFTNTREPIRVWDIANGRWIRSLTIPSSAVGTISIASYLPKTRQFCVVLRDGWSSSTMVIFDCSSLESQ